MSSCPDENTLMGLWSGQTSPELERHLASCDRCRLTIAKLVTAGHSIRAAALPPGALVGRYQIVTMIGEGAMGRVYAAVDPVLERKIGLKVLHPLRDGPKARERMLQEAKALAKFSHPNLVTVHDAGELDGSIYLAMEYVEGPTLRAWREQSPRTHEQTVAVYLQAARGLAAIHAAGLVHRDFKPENVLVGLDGRARVSDFGLARPVSQALGPLPTMWSGEGASTASQTRGVGTPAYMAPEQIEGLPLDARSDQFSFCVALAESLTGTRPFVENSRATVEKGPALGGVSTRVERVLRKGLAADPSHRFSGLQQLIRALEPRGRSTGALIAVISVALLVILGVVTLSNRAPKCHGAEEQVAAIWPGQRQAALRAHFKAFGPQGAARVGTLTGQIETALGAWAAVSKDNCEATRVRGDQADQVFAARQQCLTRRLVEIERKIEVLSSTPPEMLSQAVDSMTALTPLQVCSAAAVASARPDAPEDPRLADRVAAVDRQLATINALRQAGRAQEGSKLVQAAIQEAHDLPWPSAEAQALWLQGAMESQGGALSAEAPLREAWAKALAARADAVAVHAAIDLGRVLMLHDRRAEAREWLWQARAMLSRASDDPDLVARVAQEEAHWFYEGDDYDQALERAQSAYQTLKAAHGEGAISAAMAQSSIATIFNAQLRYADALEVHQKALEVVEAAVGPGDARSIGLHMALSEDLYNLRRYSEALSALEAVSSTVPAAELTGYQSARLWEMQAAVLIRLQRPREALPLARLAVEKEQQLGALRQEQEAMQTLGLALIGVEDFAAGHAQLDALRARITERSGADHNDITQTLDLEGQALMEHGKYALALPLVIESARRRHAEGTDPFAEGYSYSLWGQCQLALGNQVEGRAHLRRAVALLETTQPLSTVALAEAREKLAKSTKAP